MPIGTITQDVSTIPAPPHRGVDVQTQFVIKQEDFQDHLQGTTVTELNTLKDQLNDRVSEINSTTTTMNGYANTASAGASTATTKAGEASTSASGALTSRNQASTFATNSSNSATKASQWADNAYNVEVETGKYSAKHWSIVAQNATSGKIDKVTSTDNAIVRFDGATGDVQNSNVIIDDNGNLTAASGSIILLHAASHAQLIGINTDVIYGNMGAFATKFYTDGAERMRISSNGNILVGTTTDNGVDKLQVNGSIKYVRKSGAFVGETKDKRTITSNASTQLGTLGISNSSVIVEILSTSGMHSFPIYGYGGISAGWQFNYMNPQTAVWSHSQGISMSFTEQGASPNTYYFYVSDGTGIATIQATTYNSPYTVTITGI